MRPGGRLYWAMVSGYVLLLFSIQPRLGFWVDEFKAAWGEVALDRTMSIAAALIGVVVILLVVRAWPGTHPFERASFAVAIALYAIGVLALDTPQERLHYAEYGVLSAAIYGGVAAGRPISRQWRYVIAAVLVTAALGWLDEELQGRFWERRYFDWRDVRLNGQAALLGVAAGVPIFNGLRRRSR